MKSRYYLDEYSRLDEHFKNEKCCLSHVSSDFWVKQDKGRIIPNPPANDCIVIPLDILDCLGVCLDPYTPEYLPICSQCVSGLLDASLILCYCLDCDSSQWITRSIHKKYPLGDIFYQKKCLHCCGEGEIGSLVYIDSIMDRIRKATDMCGIQFQL